MKPTKVELNLLKRASKSHGWIWIDGDKGTVYLRNEGVDSGGGGPDNYPLGWIRREVLKNYK